MCVRSTCIGPSRPTLQWGRGLAAADVGGGIPSASRCNGLLQWGRGLAAADVRRISQMANPYTLLASMGPRPRSRGCDSTGTSGVTLEIWASMGPRPRSRGCLPVVVPLALAHQASMGPRPRSRGCENGSAVARMCEVAASMGPRPRSRGCTRSPTAVCVTIALQWGRGLAAADVR